MGPQNMPMGNEFGTDIPETQVDDTSRAEIANAAKFSKSKEFQALKTHLGERIKFYQTYLPDGRPVQSITDEAEQGRMWITANAIIGEFEAVISAYEQAAKLIADEAKKNNG